jgi:predicted acetyltransferase
VRLQPADPRLAALHEQAHRGHNGTVRRGDFLWFRALRGLGQQVWITGVEKDGVLRGYVAYQKLPADGHAPTVNVTDLVGADADAVGAAWAMVAALGAMGDAVKAKVPPWSPAGRSASRRDSRFSVSSVWMLRIADASAAMAARGWNPMVRGGIALDVRCDQGIATERLRLDVAEGRASVQPCGQAAVRVDVRGLAQLFTGWLPARQVRFAGLLDADDAACDTLDLLFAGPAPWMSARF